MKPKLVKLFIFRETAYKVPFLFYHLIKEMKQLIKLTNDTWKLLIAKTNEIIRQKQIQLIAEICKLVG